MTRFLVATDSVHTTAAACDYLHDRLDADDSVVVLAVTNDMLSERDAGDALNVASVRSAGGGSVDTRTQSGDAASAILDCAATVEADEIVIGVRGGAPGTQSESLGETTQSVLAESERPVVVLPVASLD